MFKPDLAALTLAQSMAEYDEVKCDFKKLYDEMRKDTTDERELTIRITQAMLDGLLYGNWPR